MQLALLPFFVFLEPTIPFFAFKEVLNKILPLNAQKNDEMHIKAYVHFVGPHDGTGTAAVVKLKLRPSVASSL
jgi:hypothetical protein